MISRPKKGTQHSNSAGMNDGTTQRNREDTYVHKELSAKAADHANRNQENATETLKQQNTSATRLMSTMRECNGGHQRHHGVTAQVRARGATQAVHFSATKGQVVKPVTNGRHHSAASTQQEVSHPARCHCHCGPDVITQTLAHACPCRQSRTTDRHTLQVHKVT